MTRPLFQNGYVEHIEFAISLAQLELTAVSDGALLDLKDKLYDFLMAEIRWSFGARPQPFTASDIIVLGNLISSTTITDDFDHVVDDPVELWQGLKSKTGWRQALAVAGVQQFADSFAALLKAVRPGSDFRDETDCDDLLYFNIDTFGQDVPGGDLVRIAMSRLLFYLVASGIAGEQIRSCPDCKQIFLIKQKPRNDKSYHCSTRCAQLAATRAYRERNRKALEAKERERSHRRYAAKQRRKHGPRVKVQRRRRPLSG
jgi:hypothetical protein